MLQLLGGAFLWSGLVRRDAWMMLQPPGAHLWYWWMPPGAHLWSGIVSAFSGKCTCRQRNTVHWWMMLQPPGAHLWSVHSLVSSHVDRGI